MGQVLLYATHPPTLPPLPLVTPHALTREPPDSLHAWMQYHFLARNLSHFMALVKPPRVEALTGLTFEGFRHY